MGIGLSIRIFNQARYICIHSSFFPIEHRGIVRDRARNIYIYIDFNKYLNSLTNVTSFLRKRRKRGRIGLDLLSLSLPLPLPRFSSVEKLKIFLYFFASLRFCSSRHQREILTLA